MWKLWMQCNRTHNNDWVRTVANHISLCIHVLVTLIVNFSENRPNIYCMVMRMILLCITRKWETVMCNILCMCDGLVFLWFIMIFIFFYLMPVADRLWSHVTSGTGPLFFVLLQSWCFIHLIKMKLLWQQGIYCTDDLPLFSTTEAPNFLIPYGCTYLTPAKINVH